MSDTLTPQRTGWAPARHFAERSILGLFVVAAAGLAFGVLLLLVRVRWGPLTGFDGGIADALNRLVSPHPWVVDALRGVSRLGGRPIMLWLVVIAVVLLLIRRQIRLATYLVVAGVGALVLDPSLKILVGRLRPVVETPVATAPGNSFPSGHALGSLVVYGALTLIFLAAVPPRWRKLFIAVPALLVLLIGFSRVALGVHFTSDVLAGWLLGAAWLGVTAYAFRVWRRETGRDAPPVGEGLDPGADVKPAPLSQGDQHPWIKTAELLTGWVLVFGVLFAFGYFLNHVTEGTGFGDADDGVNRWLQTFRTASLDDLSFFWSKAGDTHAITIILPIACLLALAVWRQWRPVVFLLVVMAGEITLFLCTAAAVGRPRPEVEQMDGQMPTSSFPSGHIAATMCIWVAIAILVIGRFQGWYRWLALAPAIVFPLGVALSRMYRGMHHPTDVLGAAILTALWVGLVWWVIRPTATNAGPRP
ncbi:phosphatase PAP2 family protein [Actinoplanes sp. NPDC051633]|uniref:phosphatase PAP2 family protein n=1 Tax=Actinoplanes sp. NPDC051633 TaxID=3155670 RepID=UPI0034481F78